MQQMPTIPYEPNRQKFYAELQLELRGMLGDLWLTNLANTSAALMLNLPRINWVGFYLNDGTGQMHLGPFQGRPACLSIALGKGVCGKAAVQRKTQLVDDVHQFDGHIACDPASRSELVVPLIWQSKVLGVLDIDSPELARFDAIDQAGLEGIAATLIASSHWKFPLISRLA